MSKSKINLRSISKVFSVMATTTILIQAVLSPIAVLADELPNIQQVESKLASTENNEKELESVSSDEISSEVVQVEALIYDKTIEKDELVINNAIPPILDIEESIVGNVPLGYLPEATLSVGISDTGKTILSSKSAISGRATGNSSGQATAYYGGYATSTSYITVDGKPAWCIDPSLAYPLNQQYMESVYHDLGVFSIMYYADASTEKGYVDAYVALNYYLGHFNSPAMAADPGVAALLAHAYAQDAPNGSFDLSNKVQTANWNNSSNRQETGWYQTSYTGSNQHYTINVPSGVTAVLSDGRSLGAGTHNIDVSVSFKLTAGPAYDGTISFDVPTNVVAQGALLFTPTSGNVQRVLSPGYQTDPITVKGIKATFKAQLGNIKVDKKDSESGTPIPGTSYKVVNSAGVQVATGKTAADGSLMVKDLLFGDYQVIETGAAYGFTINITPKSATVKPAETTTVSFVNEAVKGKLEVQKVDADTGLPTAQGDATLVGAVYGVYNKAGTLLDTLAFNGTSLVTKELDMPGGDLEGYLQEITAPTGYNLNPDKIPFLIKYKDQDTRVVQINVTAEDEVIRGSVSIQKFFAADDTTSSLLFPELGAEFTATLISSGVEADRQTSGIDGKVEFKNLVYGKYVIKQTKTPPGKLKVGDFEVDVYENGRTYYYNIVNQKFKSLLKIRKIDFDSKNNILKAGIPFKVKNLDTGEFVIHNVFYPTPIKYDVFETNEDGELVLPQMLDYNEKGYELYEMSAPDGYVLDKKTLKFFVNEESLVGDMITISFENKAQVSKITLNKTGEILTDAELSETDYGTQYTPVFTQKPLEGAEFDFMATEDIFTNDGTLRYAEGEVVDSGVSNADGEIITNPETNPFYPGKYEAVETSAPVGYVLDPTPIPFEVVYEGEDIEISSTAVQAKNKLQELLVKIYKTEGAVIKWEDGQPVVEQAPSDGKVFGVFARDAFTFDENEVIPADGLLAVATTIDGIAEVQAKFPQGKFYVKELDAGDSHLLDEIEYEFEFTAQDNAPVYEIGIWKDSVAYGKENMLKIARYSIENELATAEVELVKVDVETDLSNETPLANVPFQLIQIKDGKEEILGEYQTDVDGKINVPNVPVGDYRFREVKSLEGYLPLEKDIEFSVSLDQNGTKISLKAINKRIPPSLRTLATGINGEKNFDSTIDNTIVDDIFYENIITGQEMPLVTELYEVNPDGSFGKKTLSQEETVTFTQPNGTHRVTIFIPKGTLDPDKEYVFVEKVYRDPTKEILYVEHNDPKDKDQTIHTNKLVIPAKPIVPVTPTFLPQTGGMESTLLLLGLLLVTLTAAWFGFSKLKKKKENQKQMNQIVTDETNVVSNASSEGHGQEIALAAMTLTVAVNTMTIFLM